MEKQEKETERPYLYRQRQTDEIDNKIAKTGKKEMTLMSPEKFLTWRGCPACSK